MAGGVLPSAVEPRLGRAAFVALRLVDLLGAEHTTLHPDAFHYQYVATVRCCRDLPPGLTETSHLVGLVRGTGDAFQQRSPGLVFPPCSPTPITSRTKCGSRRRSTCSTRCSSGRRKAATRGRSGARLRRARVYRKLNEFDAAEQSYAEGLGRWQRRSATRTRSC